jgi:hypothetical protein
MPHQKSRRKRRKNSFNTGDNKNNTLHYYIGKCFLMAVAISLIILLITEAQLY